MLGTRIPVGRDFISTIIIVLNVINLGRYVIAPKRRNAIKLGNVFSACSRNVFAFVSGRNIGNVGARVSPTNRFSLFVNVRVPRVVDPSSEYLIDRPF